MYEMFEAYINMCGFVGILMVTSAFLYGLVFLLTESWKECFKPLIKKLLKKLAIHVYRICK